MERSRQPDGHNGASTLRYRVDGEDRIVAVSDNWDARAAEGDGTAAFAACVLGRPLIDFVKGDATRMFVRAALQAARATGVERVLPYRCDTPTAKRQFDMVVVPAGGGFVDLVHVLRTCEARARPPVRAPRAGWRCSQCLSVRWLGSASWVDDGPGAASPLAEDVCPACQAQLFGAAEVAW